MAEAKGKSSTIFYHEWLDLLEDFSDEEAGQLLKAVLLFDSTGTKTQFKDRGMKTAFKQMIATTSRNRERYESACQKKAEYYRKKSKGNGTTVQSTIEDYSTVTDNDNDNDNDNEHVNDNDSGSGSDNDNDNDNYTPQPPLLPEKVIPMVVWHWNQKKITNQIAMFQPSEPRAKAMWECIGDDLDGFISTIESLDDQEYLSEQYERGRSVIFDWFVKPENFQKVKEGNYKKSWKKEKEGEGGLKVDW